MNETETLRGVNLGNWFVLERWQAPQLFDGTTAVDEYTLCEQLGPRAERILRHHRETWITDDDLAWIASHGLNAVRLPIGYWIVEPDGPYVASPELLDATIDGCQRHGLAVVLDLHGLPGSQSIEHHTGRGGHFRWPDDPDCYARSLDVIEHLAARYADKPCIRAFSLVNEPSQDISRDRLVAFYEDGTERVRQHMPADRVTVVIAAYSEGKMDVYHGCMGDRPDIWTDVHLYQSFCGWPNEDLDSYIAEAVRRNERLDRWIAKGPLIVGEWSLSWPPQLRGPLDALDAGARDALVAEYGRVQWDSFEKTKGHFFWSYRTDSDPLWCYRTAVARGWLPSNT